VKIVVLTHNYIRRPGDLTALYLHRLSVGLVSRGCQITVVCPHATGLLREEVIDGVRIVRFPYPFSGRRPLVYSGAMHRIVAGSLSAKIVFLGFLWSFYRSALAVCRSIRPNIIWANWWVPPGLVAARIARKTGRPLVISSHGTDLMFLGKGVFITRLSRYVYNRAERATVVSHFLKNHLSSHVKAIEANRVHVIPMPAGMETFPQTPPPDNTVPVFLSVARYDQQKRLGDVIDAAARLFREGIFFKLHMVGEGPLEEELKARAERLGLSGIVTFSPLVSQSELAHLYQGADAVILVSEGEGFGLVLVEAGFTGRPAIAARSGGIVDIIEDGVNGLLVVPGDVEGLAAAMKELLTDPQKRSAMGANAWQMAHERFASDILVEKMHRLFVGLGEYRRSK